MPGLSRSFLHTISTRIRPALVWTLILTGCVGLIGGLTQALLTTSSVKPSLPPPPPSAIRADLGHPGPWGMLRFRAIAKAGYLPNPEFSTYPFRDFWQRWHLVTVRYRTDIKELRWVYANNKAWAVLIRGGRHYPVGSRIAKIAYNAVPDRLFPDSLIPSAQAVRIQMMVKVPPTPPSVSRAGSTRSTMLATPKILLARCLVPPRLPPIFPPIISSASPRRAPPATPISAPRGVRSSPNPPPGFRRPKPYWCMGVAVDASRFSLS